MSRHYKPLTCCDSECAAANHCGAMGGVQCPDCGCWFCPDGEGDEDGRCDDCVAARRREQED